MSNKDSQVVIRMGASHWDAQIIPQGGSPLHFDIRSMDRDQRKTFFRTFNESYRKMTKINRRARHK